jgi:Cu-processing system ATP-binding protein
MKAMNGAASHGHVMLVQDDAQKMALLRQAAGDPCVRNIEIEAPTLDQLYAHFLQTQESAA